MGVLDAPGAPAGATKRTQVDLSGGAVTLTATQIAARAVELVNASATVVVTVPVPCALRIRNATDYAQTIKRAGGTGTISLDSGVVAEVHS